MALFSFLRSRQIPPGMAVDMHSHLLPAVDDGVQTLEESLTCIEGLMKLGYRAAVTTPHIYPEVFDNDEADLRERFDQFTSDVHKRFPDFALGLGAEYFFSEQLWDRIRDGGGGLLLLSRKPATLLVEFEQTNEPLDAGVFFGDCLSLGIVPVLAHVERYAFVQTPQGRATIDDWRERGVKMQLNIGSLQGQYGPSIQQLARTLLRSSSIDIIGTDLHRAGNLPYVQKGWARFSPREVPTVHSELFPVIS